MLRAEKRIVKLRFGGNRAAYVAALGRRGADEELARALIADELRRLALARKVAPPVRATSEIAAYQRSKGGTRARLVQVTPAPSWLRFRSKGLALASLAPRDGLPACRPARPRP